MERIKFLFIINILVTMLLLSVIFSGCRLPEQPERKPVETFTDSSGNKYANENYFRFDSYDTVELIISATEKFVLYDNTKDDYESGVGEWHKNGIVLPIEFHDFSPITSWSHGDIYIWYNESALAYLPLDVQFETTPFIAKIDNDSENPMVSWWKSGNFVYNASFHEKASVECVKRTRGEDERWLYISNEAYDFYNVEDGQKVTYSCPEGNFQWDGTTGEGVWTVNDIIIPVRVSFNIRSFQFFVFEKTDRNYLHARDMLFSFKGQSIDSTTASYLVDSAPDIYEYGPDTFTVVKLVE